MKKVSTPVMALLLIASAHAQQKQGKVTYQRESHTQIRLNNGGNDEPINNVRREKFELNFANNKMTLKGIEDDIADEAPTGGLVIRTFGSSPDDVTYCDLDAARKVDQREVFDKRYLITDSIRKGNWKLAAETKAILNYTCQKATSQRIGKRFVMMMEDGKMERKEVTDTSVITAWFTMDIPVSVGPELQGQLPGLILELETNNGRVVYTALDISDKPNLSSIKEPTKGKKMTSEEFAEERKKMMDEMQKNGPGNIRFRAG